MLGGEALSADLIQRTQAALPDCRIINAYGPTEASVTASAEPFPCGVPPEPPVSTGRPISNVKIFVLDEHLQPVPIGVPGELCIAGHCLARGCKQNLLLTVLYTVLVCLRHTKGKDYKIEDCCWQKIISYLCIL